MMDNISRDEVQTILQRADPALRKYLNVDTDFTRNLVAKDVLTDEERANIDDIHSMHQRVDTLLDMMKRKPETAYQSFMQALQDKVDAGDLYKDVKSIEQDVFQGACVS